MSDEWVVYEGNEGPGQGKHIVLVSGDEEYRSEEALPALGRILAVRHGFKCTVLFAINAETGEIAPDDQTNIPGLEALADADMMIIATRFRNLPDEQMKHIVDFTNSGKPIMGMRTATHAFNLARADTSYASLTWNSKNPEGGWGRQVLGETWVSHHGHHAFESTRGVIDAGATDHPVVKGCEDIWGPTDVYEVRKLTDSPLVLINGQVLQGMNHGDKVNTEKPTMPVAWIKNYTSETGNTARVFCTTMGAATDLPSEGMRRLLVNGAYWCLGMEEQIPGRANVEIVGDFDPTPFGFGTFKKGTKPSDYAL
ncbi:MAG: ThuA domain-containing protein [Planctomycetota bacterium]|nr:ThuA domain-containing protein [Planctomycetota bacterium]MDA1139784.1 ThuA domain-containing protein [Planctomycetota bacterium]